MDIYGDTSARARSMWLGYTLYFANIPLIAFNKVRLAIDSIANPHQCDDLGTIIALPDETCGLKIL
jgi:hypothetical protein